MTNDPARERLRRSIRRYTAIEASGIRDVWTPHQPVSSVDLFSGRTREIDAIVDAIQTPGQHAILFGDRGVGKSSLAVVATILLENLFGNQTHVVRCDSSTTFTSIVSTVFEDLGIDFSLEDVSTSTRTQATGRIGVPILGAEAETELTTTSTRRGRDVRLSPAAVCRSLTNERALIVIDEFDAVRARDDRHSVAELIKQLSDARTQVKVLVVGIGTSTADLLAGHPSVHRNLKEVKLGRMSRPELRNLIATNTDKTGQTFAPSVANEIVHLSDGFPYFAQLLGLKCAELAVVAGRRTVFTSDLPRALRAAADDAEETLRTAYQAAVRSQETPMYEAIVTAAASIDTVEISAPELRSRVSALVGHNVLQREMNNCFPRLVSGDGQTMLRRESRGVYRFSDPRMKVYVRILARVQT